MEEIEEKDQREEDGGTEELVRRIGREEMEGAIRRLRKGKAAGVDQWRAEW